MEPRARAFIEALIQSPEWSVTGSPMQTQAGLIFGEGQGRVGQGAPCGAITREINQDLERTGRHLPVAGKPGDRMVQEPPLCCRPCRHPWGGALDVRRPNQVSTKASAP